MLYKDMTDIELRDAYRGLQGAMFAEGEVARSLTREGTRRASARRFGRNLRHVEIIEAIARKRGIRL